MPPAEGSGLTVRGRSHQLHATDLGGYGLSDLGDGLLFRRGCATISFRVWARLAILMGTRAEPPAGSLWSASCGHCRRNYHEDYRRLGVRGDPPRMRGFAREGERIALLERNLFPLDGDL